MTRTRLAGAGAVLLALGSAACARPLPPPGGELPADAPVVIETEPAPLSVHDAWRRPVVIRFDRRISEQLPANPVIVSPATSAVRVQRGRSEVRISLEDGWQPGRIYRVVLVRGVRDRFGNQTTEPVEVVFSTGPSIPATAIAGFVTDRITGRPAGNALVEAVRRADSLVYIAPVDTAGFFALRNLPLGEYETRAFSDINRNRRHDPTEPVSLTAAVVLAAGNDTVPVIFSVLPPDTTPARLVRALPRDSLQLRLEFDDYFEPDAVLDDARVALFLLPDSVPGPAGRIMTPAQHAARERELAGEADDTAAAAPAQAPQQTSQQAAVPLPTRDLVVVLDEPLLPERDYRVSVGGLTNIQGVPGGGGTATFTVPARPAPPAVPPAEPPGEPAAERRGDPAGARRGAP